MPLIATRGAASAQGFGEFAQVTAANYIEEVFSTYLYTGTGANLTITNNIDLSTKGGLVWIKIRSATGAHRLFDTARGATKYLASNGTAGSATDATSLTAFNSTGFSLGNNDAGDDTVNGSGYTYASWTFREQAKFFDVVTYTGTGSNTTIPHALGSVPGCILVKKTSTGTPLGAWAVYHRSLANTQYLVLNDTAAAATGATWWNSTTPTSTVFSLGTDASVNASGVTYVAYLFAHDAGGFGLTGADNVISCGGFTTDGSGNATVSLGYEPQWILTKRTSSATNWQIYDNMRGFTADNVAQKALRPDTNTAESGSFSYATNSTGFSLTGTNPSDTFIYIACRRGPMKVPTTGTSVFATVARTGTGATATVTAGFPVDMYLMQRRPTASFPNIVDRLRGNTKNIQTYQTDAETTTTNTVTGFDNMTAAIVGADTPGYVNESAVTFANQMFRRAPSFMDVVCWTGTGSGPSINHNLTVVPELIISKRRDTAQVWYVWQPSSTFIGTLNTTDAFSDNGPSPATATQFKPILNTSGATFVAYLFATCVGVSKVGTYTGTGTTQTINCGFTAGSRFIMIKRTDSTGAWYVWDSARGIIAGNDPYLLLNSTAAEVTNTDYVDTAATGFEISSTAPAAINANGGTFIFLAIA